jgi:hypothetical protein
MSTSIKRLMELEAAHLVEEVLGGNATSRDRRGPGATDGSHDFDVALPNGRSAALEVTTAAREEIVATFAAMKQLYDAKFPDLTYNWSLTARHPDEEHRGPQVREITRTANSLLRDLELAGVTEFDTVYRSTAPTTDLLAQEAVGRFGQFGVFAGRQMGVARSPGDAYVVLALVGGGGVMDPDALNQSVRREADANVAKLARSGADECHLFVWIDGTMFSEEIALYLRHVPTIGPSLPPPIATVWVATWGPGQSYRSNTSRLWRASPPGGWKVLAVPELRTTGPVQL